MNESKWALANSHVGRYNSDMALQHVCTEGTTQVRQISICPSMDVVQTACGAPPELQVQSQCTHVMPSVAPLHGDIQSSKQSTCR